MALIEWTNKLETGIDKIDFQHRNLVNMINEIADVANEKDINVRNLVIEVNVGRLLEYTVYHFQTEEDLFAECKFEHAAEHIKAHEALKINAVDLATRFGKGEDVAGQLLNFLKAWLENHIVGSDMKYVSTIKKVHPDL
jgi:methyl-accepting chemotaxis protein/hemerythrin